jgi:predicted  nucleic acid-binding Zn-ribbon protein
MSMDEIRRGRVLERAPENSAELAPAIHELADEIRGLRAAMAGDGGLSGRRELERHLHDLAEALEEVEADNAALRDENHRLLAAQAQIGALLAAPDPDLVAANERLIEALAAAESNVSQIGAKYAHAQAEAERAHALLRTIDSSRAWRLLCHYWSWAGRLGWRSRSAGSE